MKYHKEKLSLSVLFFTHWEDHPYIRQITQHLSEIGIRVEFSKSTTLFWSLLFKKNKPDIIHLHWLSPFFIASNLPQSVFCLLKLIFGLLLAKTQGIKIVWTVHNLNNHEAKYEFIDNIGTITVGKFANSIIAHCDLVKPDIAKFARVRNTHKIYVIPHGDFSKYYNNTITRREARDQLTLDENQLVFLFFGVIRPYKGIIDLIENFENLSNYASVINQKPKLLITGRIPPETPLDENLRTRIEQSTDIIFKPGYVADDQIQVYMNASDVAVFPYRDILTSGSVILAMSFGKPCIAPSIGCVSEVLGNRGNFLYQPSDPNGLLDSLKIALEKKKNLKDIGIQNKKATENWNWSSISHSTREVYEKSLI